MWADLMIVAIFLSGIPVIMFCNDVRLRRRWLRPIGLVPLSDFQKAMNDAALAANKAAIQISRLSHELGLARLRIGKLEEEMDEIAAVPVETFSPFVSHEGQHWLDQENGDIVIQLAIRPSLVYRVPRQMLRMMHAPALRAAVKRALMSEWVGASDKLIEQVLDEVLGEMRNAS